MSAELDGPPRVPRDHQVKAWTDELTHEALEAVCAERAISMSALIHECCRRHPDVAAEFQRLRRAQGVASGGPGLFEAHSGPVDMPRERAQSGR